MIIFERLKSLGEIEIPLSAVVVIIAITVIALHQPKQENTYIWPVSMEQIKSQQIHGV